MAWLVEPLYCKSWLCSASVCCSRRFCRLDYKKWGDCPPRGPVGRADYICGTFDHVVLLIGRLICFIDKDRPRKIKAGHAKSHSATPGPSFPTKGEPLGRHPPMLMPSGPMPGPGFWGMAPSDGPSHMPRAFEPTQPLDSSMPQTPAEDDLEAAARRATAEWQTIIDAFDKMEEMMLSAFAPLPIGPTQPLLPTPFGPAIVYPSSTIAAVWTWFLCGRIVALRSHPSTPAATIYAVGAAMQNTHELAMRVGRISYPLTSNFNGVPPEVNHAGAFAECCLPMFFAGVQFLTKPQREWTLRRLQEIETLTGWSTIALIANGCESNWVALGAKGISETWTKRYGVEEGEDKTLVEEISEEEEPLITPNGDPTARSVDPALQEAQMRKAERQKGFATFKKKDGEKMYAYKVYNSDEKERLLG